MSGMQKQSPHRLVGARDGASHRSARNTKRAFPKLAHSEAMSACFLFAFVRICPTEYAAYD